MAKTEIGKEKRDKNNPEKPPPSTTPWDDLSIPKVEPHLISEIRDEIFRVKDALTPEGKNDLGYLATLVKRTNKDVKIPPKVNALDLYEACDFLGDINIGILIPSGEVLSVAYIGERAFVTYGKIREETWKGEAYLKEDQIWIARVDWLKTPPNILGFSCDNFAFVDPEKSRMDAHNMYLIVSKQVPYPPHPLLDLLTDQLQYAQINADEYCTLLGENRLLQEEIRHAKDHVFVYRVQGLERDHFDTVAMANTLLKPTSLLRIAPDSEKEKKFSDQIRALGTLEYCARLGGIISEVTVLLESGKPDHAFCAFLDYLYMHALHREGQPPTTLSDPEVRYWIASRYLFSGLADLGMHSHEEVLNRVIHTSEHPGVEALKLLTEVFQVDFWNDEERAQLVR